MAMRPRGGAGAGPNRPGRTTTVRPVYETFTPVFQRQQDEEAEKLIIYLPGFSKENIKVSTEGKTTLKVRGERLIGNNKWNRFLEEFQAPEDCNMRGIHARFDNGILTITMPIPKKIPPPVTPNTQQEETTTLQKQPYIPPFLRTKDEHPPPLLAPQTTPQGTQNQPPKVDENISQKETIPPPPPPKEVFQQKPLNAASDDGFAENTSQFRDEKRMEGAIIAAKPPNEDDDDDFGAYKSLLHSVERQKKAVGPKFPKDYEDESPPSPSVLAAAKHGDQKSLEGQEKVTTGGGQKIGLKDFVEGGEKIRSEVKAKGTITQPLFDDDDGRNKTTAEVDQSVKKTSMTTSGGGGDFRLGKAAEAVKGGGVSDPKEERQLLVNAGVAVLVILALGAYIYNTVGTRKSD